MRKRCQQQVSLNAFHVDVGEKAASAGSSSIRAALAGAVTVRTVLGRAAATGEVGCWDKAQTECIYM